MSFQRAVPCPLGNNIFPIALIVAVDAVMVREPVYLGRRIRKVEPIIILLLLYLSLLRKRLPFTAGLTGRVFQSPADPIQDSNLQPSVP